MNGNARVSAPFVFVSQTRPAPRTRLVRVADPRVRYVLGFLHGAVMAAVAIALWRR